MDTQTAQYRYLNLEYIYAYFNENMERIDGLFKMFIKSTEEDGRMLLNAIESENYALIKTYAHKLKSSYRYIGLGNMGDFFEVIEKRAKSKEDIGLIRKMFFNCDPTCTEIRAEVFNFLKEHSKV